MLKCNGSIFLLNSNRGAFCIVLLVKASLYNCKYCGTLLLKCSFNWASFLQLSQVVVNSCLSARKTSKELKVEKKLTVGFRAYAYCVGVVWQCAANRERCLHAAYLARWRWHWTDGKQRAVELYGTSVAQHDNLWSYLVSRLGSFTAGSNSVMIAHILTLQIKYAFVLLLVLLLYTVSQKKRPTSKLSVTLSNLNRFSKLLHCWKACKIRYKTNTTLPTSP